MEVVKMSYISVLIEQILHRAMTTSLVPIETSK